MAERVSLHHGRMLRILLLLSLAMPALLTGTARGQHAENTAYQRLRLTAYGMFSYVDTNFDGNSKNRGGTIGGDIDGFRLLPHTEVGMDARYAFSRGDQTNQYFVGGGPRVTLNVGRFKPYGDFIFGRGKAVFIHAGDPNYKEDQTGALTYGGGFDYQLTRSWAVRADIQRQRWRFSHTTPYFYPVAASVGVSYVFHFHSRTGPGF